jgi:hypothetical protein
LRAEFGSLPLLDNIGYYWRERAGAINRMISIKNIKKTLDFWWINGMIFMSSENHQNTKKREAFFFL